MHGVEAGQDGPRLLRLEGALFGRLDLRLALPSRLGLRRLGLLAAALEPCLCFCGDGLGSVDPLLHHQEELLLAASEVLRILGQLELTAQQASLEGAQ